MRALRPLAVAAVMASTVAFGPAPARAETVAATFSGTVTIGCFGCGDYGPTGNSASITLTGLYGHAVNVATSGSAVFAVRSPAGPTCTAGPGYADGRLSVATPFGYPDQRFFWTQIGDALYISLPDIGVSGVGTFTVTSPVGNPCGGSVTATISGVLAGI
ncbi:MAG TPA: hypothetical protein VNQ77_13885 [Frankiaceae bacterium]|nr:hypothetical protein [Frankiaceae bacterium]